MKHRKEIRGRNRLPKLVQTIAISVLFLVFHPPYPQGRYIWGNLKGYHHAVPYKLYGLWYFPNNLETLVFIWFYRRGRSSSTSTASAAAIPTPISTALSGHSALAGLDSRHAVLRVEQRRRSPAHPDGLVPTAAGVRGGAEDRLAEPQAPRQPEP